MNAKVEAKIAEANRLNAETAVKAGYLCGQCAEDLGGKWPRGHRAPATTARCPLCTNCRPLMSWNDWNWPKAPKINDLSKKLREV